MWPILALAITGIETASWIPLIIEGSDMRATPPWARMSAGTRSSAITATAPASSAIFASAGVTTSMITPPFSISARPVFNRKVARSDMERILDRPARPVLLEFVGANAIFVRRFVAGVETVGQALDQGHQRRVRPGEARAVGGEVERQLGVLSHLGHRRVGDGQRAGSTVVRQLHRPQQQRVGAA